MYRSSADVLTMSILSVAQKLLFKHVLTEFIECFVCVVYVLKAAVLTPAIIAL